MLGLTKECGSGFYVLAVENASGCECRFSNVDLLNVVYDARGVIHRRLDFSDMFDLVRSTGGDICNQLPVTWVPDTAYVG